MSEYWLSGPVEGVPALLQPAAHTFLQVRQDVRDVLAPLSREQVWQRIGESASIGYHALHIAGATDRLLTYARGEQLTDAQLETVRSGEAASPHLDADALIGRVEAAIDAALAQLRATPETILLDARAVGRKRLSSTTLGVLVHAAEHAYRHAGQIATLARVLA